MDLKENVNDLPGLISQGKMLDAFEKGNDTPT